MIAPRFWPLACARRCPRHASFCQARDHPMGQALGHCISKRRARSKKTVSGPCEWEVPGPALGTRSEPLVTLLLGLEFPPSRQPAHVPELRPLIGLAWTVPCSFLSYFCSFLNLGDEDRQNTPLQGPSSVYEICSAPVPTPISSHSSFLREVQRIKRWKNARS